MLLLFIFGPRVRVAPLIHVLLRGTASQIDYRQVLSSLGSVPTFPSKCKEKYRSVHGTWRTANRLLVLLLHSPPSLHTLRYVCSTADPPRSTCTHSLHPTTERAGLRPKDVQRVCCSAECIWGRLRTTITCSPSGLSTPCQSKTQSIDFVAQSHPTAASGLKRGACRPPGAPVSPHKRLCCNSSCPVSTNPSSTSMSLPWHPAPPLSEALMLLAIFPSRMALPDPIDRRWRTGNSKKGVRTPPCRELDKQAFCKTEIRGRGWNLQNCFFCFFRAISSTLPQSTHHRSPTPPVSLC